MKKTGFVIILSIFCVVFGFAQPGGGGFQMDPEEMATRQTEQIAEYMELDDATKAKLQEINLKYAEKQSEMMQSGDFQSMRENMQTMNEEKNEELKGIFTEAQWAKYEAYLEENPGRMGRPGGAQGGGPGGGL